MKVRKLSRGVGRAARTRPAERPRSPGTSHHGVTMSKLTPGTSLIKP
jgi:hypothetical protein